jgi:hypothetical protein
MNIKQPLALTLADKLEQQFPIGTAQGYLDGEAAAELRRLHAENEALRQTMAEALRWCPGGCHAQYLLKTALARAGEKK